jgi:hypothetical protein
LRPISIGTCTCA